eukprot:TRINITY_DN58_c0_g1_i1.p1 TRINITY_DN58_c0_g1~~TRINITY_DN58_c0_g1_i1.p1  ORF type:complete len:331 (-),score=35.06 TRINITY_DN58_c0_g1_i1:37-1029(-)
MDTLDIFKFLIWIQQQQYTKHQMEKKGLSRKASHAGSWYTDDSEDLRELLAVALSAAEKKSPATGLVKLVIGPHAGYAYSAKTAAWAYKCIDPIKYKRVILLGPSHHAPMNWCALSKCAIYETPLGNIEVDTEGIEKLSKIEGFQLMSLKQDEAEHSLEMHLPFIRHVFGKAPIKLIPIMVGNIGPDKEKYYGEVLAGYMKDDETLFIASSDFCHWGMNFDYFYYKKEDGQIFESIEKLDRRGMEIIEKNDPEGFNKYLEETENTICGRHPISITLNAVKAAGGKYETKFVHYSQSNKVKQMTEFSVSYAAAYSAKLPQNWLLLGLRLCV